ncbi:MAG TPA: immunoglobulin domain-containing protein [Dongiaceae bacterium]|nr:immunoglobulin domain-containing protein [Dongiaceae bacterium]
MNKTTKLPFSLLTGTCWIMAAGAFAQPVITEQPQSQTNLVGATAAFSVTAAGAPPLACQWQRDNGFLFL